MKLCVEKIVDEVTVPPAAKIIFESDNLEDIRNKASDYARSEFGLYEQIWVRGGGDSTYEELILDASNKLTIRG